MSDSETLLSRWLRLKRESEASLRPADASPPAGASSAAAFDPASLPPIESIVADSDITQYLHERVPADLTRAALRSAWTADPAIRDFIGIAENQWNFNDHACIPGFGPLEAADYLMAQALGHPANVVHEMPQDTEAGERPALPPGEPRDAVRPAPAPAVEETIDAAAITGAEATTGSETGPTAAVPRTHGGALPQ